MTSTHASDQRALPLSSPAIRSPAVRAWQRAAVGLVAPASGGHSIHSYFNTCPESPDGRFVLYFASSSASGEQGDLRILERATGIERTLVAGIICEDAHRVACQQWCAGGRLVAYHDHRAGRWAAIAVNIETGRERLLAVDRLIGFGSPASPWLPLYGPHWKQGEHRDLELVNVETGEIRTALTVEAVLAAHRAKAVKLVGEGAISIFFPLLSPDGSKVMFKLARGSGTDAFRSNQASKREGKFVYDLTANQFIHVFDEWGHPSWTPDSGGILEKGIRLFHLRTGETHGHAPGSPSDHPSLSPDGRLFTTDANISKRAGGKPDEWGIVVGSLETDEFATIHRFVHKEGAQSWRIPHPHPVFSGDGRRLYFNVSGGGWTRLHVASLPDAPKSSHPVRTS
jgi:hypothetical protein